MYSAFGLLPCAFRPGGVAPLNLSDDSGCQRGSYRLHDLVFRGETGLAFLCDHLVAHADGKLAAAAFDHGRIDTRRCLDERGHTGRARKVVSNFAVADFDLRFDSFHGLIQ